MLKPQPRQQALKTHQQPTWHLEASAEFQVGMHGLSLILPVYREPTVGLARARLKRQWPLTCAWIFTEYSQTGPWSRVGAVPLGLSSPAAHQPHSVWALT